MLRIEWFREIFVIALLCTVISIIPLAITFTPAHAIEPPLPAPEHGEQWVGLAATKESVYAYSGVTYAPFDIIQNPGFRLRVAGGYGQYFYDSTQSVDFENVAVRFMGETGTLEALIGYQFRLGEWTGKIFAGVERQEHRVQPLDPGNPVNGARWGGKIASENWLNIGEHAFASLDGNYASGFKSYGVEFKTAYNVYGPLHLGLTAGAFGNETYDGKRAGLLLRYKDDDREISLAAGVSGDYDDASNPFASITYLSPF